MIQIGLSLVVGANLFLRQPIKEDHELSSELYEKIPGLLRDGRLVPNRVKVLDGGLADVETGFQKYRDNKILGHKIVYRMA